VATNSSWPAFFRFEWKRDTSGYDLKGGSQDPLWDAVDYNLGNRLIVARGRSVETYEPDERSPMLHREFLRLPWGNHEALLAFVTNHGLLGIEWGGPPGSESLAGIWRAYMELSTYVAWGHDDPALSTAERDQYFNTHCPRHMSVRMEHDNGKTILKVCPGSLLAWMWLRFAQEKAGEIEVRRCARPECGESWIVGRGSEQKTKRSKYCSDFCRVAHFRTKPRPRRNPIPPRRGA
jgi:hypothetical protein